LRYYNEVAHPAHTKNEDTTVNTHWQNPQKI
jgi:hypothetical protein